jgi:2-dehydro-3-deoxyphosphogluconate aldolase / (4S)-4-hydroxy-2-oxoglutarate aldolase
VRSEVVRAIEQSRVVAIVRQRERDVGRVLDTARALVDAGLPVVEVTLNTPGALDAIAALAGTPDAIAGAGTVLRAAEVDAVAAAGGRFVVSPDVDEDVIARAAHHGLVSLPGAMTPTEIRRAVDAGADLVKLFPAGPHGVEHLAAVRGPFRDVAYVPTGGISLDEVSGYLDAGATAVGLASALVGGSVDEVAARARRLVADVETCSSGAVEQVHGTDR